MEALAEGSLRIAQGHWLPGSQDAHKTGCLLYGDDKVTDPISQAHLHVTHIFVRIQGEINEKNDHERGRGNSRDRTGSAEKIVGASLS